MAIGFFIFCLQRRIWQDAVGNFGFCHHLFRRLFDDSHDGKARCAKLTLFRQIKRHIQNVSQRLQPKIRRCAPTNR